MIKLTLNKITFLPTIFKYLHIEKKNNTHLYTFKIFDNLPQILLSTKVNTLLKPSLDKTIRNFSIEFLTSKTRKMTLTESDRSSNIQSLRDSRTSVHHRNPSRKHRIDSFYNSQQRFLSTNGVESRRFERRQKRFSLGIRSSRSAARVVMFRTTYTRERKDV